jgi:transaldolase
MEELMQIFLDSADFAEVEKWLREGVIDGVTTNPSIMFKDKIYDVEDGARRLCALLGDRPVSVEVTTNDRDEMIRQARSFARCGSNIVVKIPVVNADGDSCLRVVNTLNREGILVNVTAILSFNQALLAAKAGATYISIFAGRIADEGNNPTIVIRKVRHWLDAWAYTAKIIVGSIRCVMDIQNAATAGAHVVTIPPQFLPKMVDHKYTRDTVRQFVADADRALKQIAEAKVASEMTPASLNRSRSR